MPTPGDLAGEWLVELCAALGLLGSGEALCFERPSDLADADEVAAGDSGDLTGTSFRAPRGNLWAQNALENESVVSPESSQSVGRIRLSNVCGKLRCSEQTAWETSRC